MVYDKERDMLLTLQNVTKGKIRTYAMKQNRSVNNFINRAIERYIHELQREE